MQLRDYQESAKTAFYRHLETRDDNPCIVLPTGAGKTPVIASICQDVVRLWSGRIMILSHVKELLVQAKEKIELLDWTLPVGIYSAGLKSRQLSKPITIAGIQSVYQRAHEFDPFDIILIDEAHLIPLDGDGMYQRFLKDAKVVNPNVRIGGLTATPYRLDAGMICRPDAILNHICHETGIKELIHQGFLCRLKSKNAKASANTKEIKVRGGEFVPDSMAEAFDQTELVNSACAELIEQSKDRKGILVFCSSVEHGIHVRDRLEELTNEKVGFVCGETADGERDRLIDDFKNRRFRWMVNVNVLTVGFDATHIDCIALLRATLSPGLYYQMVGRGFRICDGKDDCLILDFGENVKRHGPVDAIRVREKASNGGVSVSPVKECPMCHCLVHAAYSVCPECQFNFPNTREPKHGTRADGTPILSGEVTDYEFEVRSVRYSLHRKKNDPNAPPTLRVDYSVGWETWKSEWICFEHNGFARTKAEQWWELRSGIPVPDTVDEALRLCQDGCVARPIRITVRETSGERFPRIIKVVLGERFEPGDAWEPPSRFTMESSWRDVLGLSRHADIYEAETAYKKLAMQHHPDRGGSHEAMVAINLAIEQARDEVGIPF